MRPDPAENSSNLNDLAAPQRWICRNFAYI
jgi:hypothetical protein